NWQEHNMIILLGGGLGKNPNTDQITPGTFNYARIIETAELYFACKQPVRKCDIINSGGNPQTHRTSEAQVYKDALIKMNVPKPAVIIEPNSNNTRENAKFDAKIYQKQTPDLAILVTSGMHMKRALLYFKHWGITPIPAPSDFLSPAKTLLPNGYNLAMTDYAAHEYVGYMQYYVYNLLG